ncbi:MAG: fasciclin domain-containing protein [Akkermansiaceae bacterium]
MKPLIIAALAGSFTITPCALAADCSSKKQKNIVETAVTAGSFKTLASALDAAGLVKPLQGKGPFTVFAPTDEAFAKLPKGTVADLLKPENKEKLQAVLKYHVLSGGVPLSGALAAKSAKTLQGEPVRISFSKGKVTVNDAKLLSADLSASNGVIHVIDTVLLPPEPKNDIASVAKKAGQFRTLLAAVEAAGLGDALTGSKPLTVLAPTDAAFEALPKGTVESLLKPENKSKLKEILLYHVIAGSVSAGDALNAASAKTLGAEDLSFAIKDGSFKVNGATIITTDIECDNGVIHVIDAVLIPVSSSKSKCGTSSKPVVTPTQKIEEAIHNGVMVFNKGNHSKCAEIYMNCAKALAGDDQLGCGMRNSMNKLVNMAAKVHCSTEQAWVLRRGLDMAYTSLNR